MDSSHLAQLRSEAGRGNLVAERLLIQHWLAHDENDAISELLQSKRDAGQALHARFLEAELSCFHGWKTDVGWRELLQQCCGEGHPEASFVDALYRDWATHLDTTDTSTSPDTSINDPYSWQPPTWQTLVQSGRVNARAFFAICAQWAAAFCLFAPRARATTLCRD